MSEQQGKSLPDYPDFTVDFDEYSKEEISDAERQKGYDSALDNLNKENFVGKVAEFRDFVTKQPSKYTKGKKNE
jgi:hypothetical protein